MLGFFTNVFVIYNPTCYLSPMLSLGLNIEFNDGPKSLIKVIISENLVTLTSLG